MATFVASSIRKLTLLQMALLYGLLSSWRCQVLMPQPYRWGFERTTLEWDTSIAYTTNVTLISASLRQLSWLELGATELGILSDWNDVITNLPHQTQSQVSPLWMALLALKSAHEGLLISLILDTTLWRKQSYPIPQMRKTKLWEMCVTAPRLHNSSV